MLNDLSHFLLVALCLFGSIAVLLSVPAATDQPPAGQRVRHRRAADVERHTTTGTARGHTQQS